MSILMTVSVLMVFASMSFASLLIGVVTSDSVILSSNNVLSKNGVAMRGDFDWIRQLGDDCLVGVQGDSSDCDFLLSQLESSNRDHQMTFGRSAPCRSVAHLCRRIIAQYLRSKQLKVSVLIAGWNYNTNRPSLFWLDSIGTTFLIICEGVIGLFSHTHRYLITSILE
jgi:20S proteasome alpha/beta subunit